MTIGSIGSIAFQPYVYNTNQLSSASMNRLSKISDDVLDKKVDYSELADSSKNTNPLKKGQTLDFNSLFEMQMQKGRANAAKVMANEDEEKVEEAKVQETEKQAAQQQASAVDDSNAVYSSDRMQEAISAYETAMIA